MSVNLVVSGQPWYGLVLIAFCVTPAWQTGTTSCSTLALFADCVLHEAPGTRLVENSAQAAEQQHVSCQSSPHHSAGSV